MRSRRVAVLALLLLLSTPSSHPQDTARKPKKLPAVAERWVERTLRRMTTDEKIGQVVFPAYFGGFVSTESEAYREMLRRVEKDHIGGFILATRTGPGGIERSQVYSTAELTNQLQKKARIPLLIAADFERGAVPRIVEGTPFPHLMAVAAAGRPQDAYTIGKITALEARAVGVHWILAPVSDVNSNPENPIINIRSFGEDPQKVGEFVSAFVRGVEENGCMATAKHFPGHGDTATDSHLDIAKVTGDRARLEAVELVPFRAAIAAGASSIMTGHLVVPAIEPDPEMPATVSFNVLTGLLREQMGFEGLVVTDALNMGGVSRGFPDGEVAVRALLAGADVLLYSPVPDAALMALREALATGRIPMARLDAAVTRILRAKARLGLEKNRLVDVEKLNSNFRRPKYLREAQDIADRGVTLLRDDAKMIPLDARKPARVLLLAVSGDPDTLPAEPFERELRSQLDTVQTVRVDTRYFRPETVHVPPPDQYDLAIVAITVAVADRKNTVGLPANEAEMVHALLKSGKPVVMASFGSPYLMEIFPEAQTWLAEFSTQDVSQRAVARALLGQIGISGKLPVRLPGASPKPLALGDGLTTIADPMMLRPAPAEMQSKLESVYAILERAVTGSVVHGGVLAVGYNGQLAVHAFGHDRGSRSGIAVTPDYRFFDSPTPQIFLTTAAAQLLSTRSFALDAAIYRIIPVPPVPEDAPLWNKIVIRNFLEHTSGVSFYKPGESRGSQLVERIIYEPGTRREYSAAAQMLLAAIVVRLTGDRFEEYVRGRILGPILSPGGLGLPNPGEAGHRVLSYRASDLAALSQLWLNGGIYAHERLLRRSLIEQLTARKRLGESTFTTGWDVSGAPGHYFSSSAYGATEPLACSLWIDPERELFIVFCPLAEGPAEREAQVEKVRGEVSDGVFEALELVPKS